MDVFQVHEEVIADYRSFTSGFVEVRDARIKAFVDQQLAERVQWPDPWVSLNPSFASGGAVPDLVEEGLLHPEAARIFRRKSDLQDAGRDPIVLHQHQREAVEVARTGKSYVLTTGTGSGKSLAYIVPIVDAVLRERDARGGERRPGVKAIVVYPMNALANSQVGELEKFLKFGYPLGGEPVTFARYTGQESPDERTRILAEPPDILLTNYVMRSSWFSPVRTSESDWSVRPRGCASWRWTSCTPTADGRGLTSPCWYGGFGTNARPMTCRSSARARPWPVAAASPSAMPWWLGSRPGCSAPK